MSSFVITYCPKSKHYELYFPHDDEVYSWYMPKEPASEVNVRRMAHVLDRIALTEGISLNEQIAAHQGDDPGETWDEGEMQIDSWKDAKIVLHLSGKRLAGKYVMLNVGSRYGEGSYLFFRVG